jgi:hypothetical protein
MTGYKSKKTAALDKLDDDDVQVYDDAVDNNPVHEAMLFYWGERCPDYNKECVCCQAWEQYDTQVYKDYGDALSIAYQLCFACTWEKNNG